MINITYESSAGEIFDLMASRMGRLKKAAFHTYEWIADETEKQYGVKVNHWTKEPLEYEAQLLFEGTEAARMEAITAFHDAIDGDIFRGIPGKLQFGEAYISCFIRSSETAPSEGRHRTLNDIVIYCPDPFWIVEQRISIAPVPQGEPLESDKQYTDVGYGYDEGYSYPIVASAKSYRIDHFAPCDFKMVVYGPAASVAINIGGHLYSVHHQISAGEYMVIDSRESQPDDRHCYLVTASGAITNCFNDRDPASLLLQQIPAGNVTINYSQEYGIDLILYKKRSEPAWR